MDKQALVSVVITYINESDFLQEALQSAFAQDLRDIQVIVVCNDAGAREDEVELSEKYPHVLWLHETEKGSAHARNKGLIHAKGDWIQFLDVDDLLLPGKIRNQLGSSNEGAIVSPHVYRHLTGVTEFSKWKPGDVWSGIIGGKLGSTSSMLWNRKALIEIGGWNISYYSHQEYELLFRMAKKGHGILPVSRYDTIVRDRISGSITKTTKSSRAEQGIQLREEIWEFLVANKMETPERLHELRQYIFKQLRATYRRNPENTMDIFKRYFQKSKFRPEEIGIPFYNWLYSLFGFSKTESLFKIYAGLRDKYLPFLPSNK